MTTYSIYRGTRAEGIGEAPGRPSMAADQYLFASDKLWIAEIADACREWLTLKCAAVHLNRRRGVIEAWSCFQACGLAFVARSVAAGDGYLTHARACRLSDLAPGADPFALLGNSAAFDAPDAEILCHWDPPSPQPQWAQAVKQNSECAVRLLSYLYAARMQGRRIVIWAQHDQFYTGATFASLLAFARTALPRDLNRDLSLRTYTGAPDAFARQLKPDVMAVVYFDAANVMKASPGALLLASDFHPMEPYAVDESYARMVVDQVVRGDPANLFAFTPRWTSDMPLGLAPAIYQIAAAIEQPETFERWLRTRLQSAAEPPVSWDQLLPPPVWAGLSDRQLLALIQSEPAGTSALALLKLIWKAAAFRDLNVEPAPGDPRAKILEYYRAGLMQDTDAAKYLQPTAAETIFDLLDPAAHTRIGPRSCLSVVLARVPLERLPSEWVERLPQSGTPQQAAERLAAMATLENPERPVWQPLLFPALWRLLDAGEPIQPALADHLAKLNPPDTVERWVTVSEVLYRAQRIEPAACHNQLARTQNRVSRQWVIRNLTEPRWTCLAEFVPPAEWAADLQPLLDAPEWLKHIPVATVVAVAAISDEIPTVVIDELDARMASELGAVNTLLSGDSGHAAGQAARTTSELIRQGQWERWRLASKLSADEFRIAAKAWLLDNQSDRAPSMENWMLCVDDLLPHGLTGVDVAQIRSHAAPHSLRWPAAAISLCRDWGAAAEIAEINGGTYAATAEHLDHPPHGMPVDFLAYLGPDESLPPLTVVQARQLWENAGHRRDRAVGQLIRAILDPARIARDPEAAARELEVEPDLLNDPRLAKRLFEIMLVNRLRPEFVAAVKARKPQIVDGLRRDSKPSLTADAVQALLAGNALAPCWNHIQRVAVVENPLAAVLDALHSLSSASMDSLDADQKGWRTLVNALRVEPRLLYAIDGRVPLLDIAVFLNDRDSLADIVIFLLRTATPFANESWWDAFFATAGICRRRSGEIRRSDRPEHVFPLVCRVLELLFARERMWAVRSLHGAIQRYPYGQAGAPGA